jgi:hypothetical protein
MSSTCYIVCIILFTKWLEVAVFPIYDAVVKILGSVILVLTEIMIEKSNLGARWSSYVGSVYWYL